MKKIFYLMRHGQTLFNVRKKIQGSCDSPLTELGIKQAQIVANYFRNIPLSHVYSSTSERACDTLELVTEGKLNYTRLKGLKEMNFGYFEGESEDLNPSKEMYEDFFVNYGGESLAEVKERMVKTCVDIMEKEDTGIVLAVSHAGACINFLSHWENPIEEIKKGITNCIIFKYEYENKKFKLQEVIRHEF